MPLCRSLYRLLGCPSHLTMLFLALVQRAQNAQRGRVRAVIAPVAPAEIGELVIEIAHASAARFAAAAQPGLDAGDPRWGAIEIVGVEMQSAHAALEEIRTILDGGWSGFGERGAIDGSATDTGPITMGRAKFPLNRRSSSALRASQSSLGGVIQPSFSSRVPTPCSRYMKRSQVRNVFDVTLNKLPIASAAPANPAVAVSGVVVRRPFRGVASATAPSPKLHPRARPRRPLCSCTRAARGTSRP